MHTLDLMPKTILREIAPALKIVAHGSLHWKYTLLAFLGLDVRGHICIS
jgi:hypothetical protein